MLGAYLARRIEKFWPDVRSEPEIEDVDDPSALTPRLSVAGSAIDILDFVGGARPVHHGRMTDRAVSVSLHQESVLVIRRHRDGRDYCVLPGGGVEEGEQPRDAVVRELLEETGLAGTIDRHLWTIKGQDRIAHYFLILVEPGPMTLGGPEAEKQSEQNRYTPDWIPVTAVDAVNLQPAEVRDLLRDLLRNLAESDN